MDARTKSGHDDSSREYPHATPAYDDRTSSPRSCAASCPRRRCSRTSNVLVIMDVMPQGKGHTLVIPKASRATSSTSREDALEHAISAVQRVARAVKQAFDAPGVLRHAVQRAGERADGVPHALPRHPALRGRAAEAACRRHGRSASCLPSTRRRSRRRWIERLRFAPLVLIRLAHTFVWAVFAGSIVAIPIATCGGGFRAAAVAEPSGLGGGRDPRREPHALPADRRRRALHRGPRRQLRHLPSGMACAAQQADLRRALRARGSLPAVALGASPEPPRPPSTPAPVGSKLGP